jgi:hypothetical protein
MKSKLTIFLSTLILSVCTLSGNAQTSLPKGKAQLIEFTNATAQFTVPAGKTWYIYSILTDWSANTMKDDRGDYYSDDIRVFIKSLNGKVKTDYKTNKMGPQLGSRSTSPSPGTGYPIILPENTSIQLIQLCGDEGKWKEYSGIALISVIEVDN